MIQKQSDGFKRCMDDQGELFWGEDITSLNP